MMTREEVIARMRAADRHMKEEGYDFCADEDSVKEADPLADYWAGSASQQYIDRVKSGDVRTVTVDR